MKKIIYILLLLFLFVTPVSIYADLGDFNDYDSGFDSYDYDSGYDSYDYGDSSYGYHSSGSGGIGGFDIETVIIIVIIIVVVFYQMNNGNGPKGGGNGGAPKPRKNNIIVKNNTDEIITEIIKIDSNYSNEKFISWVKEVFITLQMAWSERDFAKARPFEKEELYRQHEMQINKYIEAKRINVLDRINVNQAYLYKYVRDNEYEYLTVYISARMIDYIKDEVSGNILKGSATTDCHMKYLYTFMRKNGVKTDSAKSNNSIVACPHCGAPTNITSAGKCEYCGFIVTTGEFDWVLSNIEAIKADSNIDGGGVVIRD